MMTSMIACVACLDEIRSVHTVTFRRAVSLFADWHTCFQDTAIEIKLYNDNAEAEAARLAASAIIAERPHAIVGHFASSAAAAAAPAYEAADIPLFLPAATATALTRWRTTFRVCDSDSDYADFIRCTCEERYVLSDIVSDGSVHGNSLRSHLRARPPRKTSATGEAVLFSGNCQRSIEFLRQMRKKADQRAVLLTDDALAPDIVPAAGDYGGEILIFGLESIPLGDSGNWIASEYTKRHGNLPGAYFWETVAALQIAAASAGKDIAGKTWETAIGVIKFDTNREARRKAFGVFRADGQGLRRIDQAPKQ